MNDLFGILINVGAWITLPVIALCVYDRFALQPKRPTDEDGEPVRGPHVFGWAWTLLPFCLIAAALKIGPQTIASWWSVLVVPLSWLALPLVLLAVYDIWILEPKRPRAPSGRPMPAPWYIRYAKMLALLGIAAVVMRIGVSTVFEFVKGLSEPLSYFALPVGLWCAIDSWFLSPRRQIAAGSAQAPTPVFTRAAYFVLPVLIVALVVRMISADSLDFSLVLFELSLVTGLIWLVDHLFVRKTREKAMLKGVGGQLTIAEPGTVDYARSFFPVALIVLVVRAFIFEPFRIPSDSMMPTLLDGDFIVVSKYSYGLRWPVLNRKFLDIGTPQRGDVVVFRHPPHPEVNFIKRLVGLPGDRIQVIDDHLVINGETVPLTDDGLYEGNCYSNVRLSSEKLGEHTHEVMRCSSVRGLTTIRELVYTGQSLPATQACDRRRVAEDSGGWTCQEMPLNGAAGVGDKTGEWRLGDGSVVDVVPAGYYLMIGDNRDNSDDSRGWGLVPEGNLVGKATRIWFNFDSQRPTNRIVNLDRIGKKIE